MESLTIKNGEQLENVESAASTGINKIVNVINPFTLECVVEVLLNYLNTHDLKQIRFVSQLWNEEAAKHLRSRKFKTVLLARLPEKLPIIEIVNNSKHPHLLRAINIEEEALDFNPTCLQFLENHGKYLKRLRFAFSDEIQLLHTLLTKWCPNLVQLHLMPTRDDYAETTFPRIEGPLQLEELVIQYDGRWRDRLRDQTEAIFISILSASPKLKSLHIRYYHPLAILNGISTIPHITATLDKLSLNCNQVYQRFVAFLATIKFKKLRVLRLSNLDMQNDSWEALFLNLSPTLKKLKLSNIKIFPQSLNVNDLRNREASLSPIVKTCEILKGLESLNWASGYITLFIDLHNSTLDHENLKYLKLEDVDFPNFEENEDLAEFKIGTLKETFPNLKSLVFYRDKPQSTRRILGIDVLEAMANAHEINLTIAKSEVGRIDEEIVWDCDNETEID